MSRSTEERVLLNPGFCSCLLWQAAAGYEEAAVEPMPFAIAFLVLPMVLHRETRDSLPWTTKTSLAVWLSDHPLSRVHIADRARALAPFTKEALMFGGVHGLFYPTRGAVAANSAWRRPTAAALQSSTEEVGNCAKRAQFVGRWLARSGSPETVMAVLGVRP